MLTESLPGGATTRSLKDESINEADFYKFELSRNAGYDLGEAAIRDWIRNHWPGFLRARWIEHLSGKTFWAELTSDDYGILLRQFAHMPDDLNRIVALWNQGFENVNFACWLRQFPLDQQERYREIILAIDINARRMDCKWFGLHCVA